MPTKITMKQLLETGVHFGHRSRKWNPKMKEYIFQARNGIHIIDLQQTLTNLHEIHDRVADVVARGGTVLFVGTKRQAQEAIAAEASRCASPYVNERWLGGTLTNWKTIRQRIEALKKLEEDRDSGLFDRLTKKERLIKQREIERLQHRLGGIRDMDRLPSMLFIIDVLREHTAVREANALRIPIIGVADTNSDPDKVDWIIPGNDDAIRAIRLLNMAIADAVLEGKARRKAYSDEDVDFENAVADGMSPYMPDEEGEEADERYMGTSTLAKLREGNLRFDEENEG
ncbi:MAG: 30S ribosomal protein S2 [Anaerolineae bacterium]|nr:30S ribosomal protein S2 [Anaerolineae bacterium]